MSVIGKPILVVGSRDVFALISVTYPAGSVCTASNGIITLTAGDTSGQAEFEIPTPASLPETWTISITDGNKTKSKTVSISQKWQIENVKIAYRTYLYDHGDQCTTVTGGWRSNPNSCQNGYYTVLTPTFNSNNIAFSWNRSKCSAVDTLSKIDVTYYNTISVEYSGTNPSLDREIVFGLRTGNTGQWHYGVSGQNYVARQKNSLSSLDISAVTGSYFFLFGGWNYNQSNGSGQLKAVYME